MRRMGTEEGRRRPDVDGPVLGTATNLGGGVGVPTVRVDGDCVTRTLRNLESGVAGEPMSRETLERARVQAAQLLEDLVGAYATDVADGEVGTEGTAIASSEPPKAGESPTGLLYGRVQSGKTLAMITSVAMAIDNGFRVIVVHTTNFLKLVEQTADRFKALEGPLVRSSTTIDTWQADATHVQRYLPTHGLVLVCAKDPNHLQTLLDFIDEIGASRYPALIFDDEADQATPDTTTSARAAQKPSAPPHGSTISRRIVRNDAAPELGDSIRERLLHNVFVQVTATPYALLLQNIESPLRPKFTRLLEPGTGYTGGENFFSEAHVEAEGGSPPLVFVDEGEATTIDRGPTAAPPGLARAVSFFLVSSSAQVISQPAVHLVGQNFLCHTSPKQGEHDKLSQLIRDYLERVADDLRPDGIIGESRVRCEWAYAELRKTLPEAPPFDEILRTLFARLPRRNLLTVNSSGSNAEFGRDMNFIVGGNILGRGLTIKNLLVTYYLRRAKISQMDTMLQHARMYGYRESILPFSRVFLPESLAVRFHVIHRAERDLRELLADPEVRERIPVQVTTALRATRPNVLDHDAIGGYRAGQQVYPIAPIYRRQDLGTTTERLDRLVASAMGGAFIDSEFVDVPIEKMIEMIEHVRTDPDDPSEWDTEAITAVLGSIGSRYDGRGYLYYRTFESLKKFSGSRFLTSGSIGGPDQRRARELDRPVLFMLRESGLGPAWDGVPFWHPTVVFPPSMPNQVFNVT
jgi:hypothetical protein